MLIGMPVATITVGIAMAIQYTSMAAAFNLRIIFKIFVKLKLGCVGTPMRKLGHSSIYRC